jgi:hypothetical protein
MTSRPFLLLFVGLALLRSTARADEPKAAAKNPDVFDIVPADAMGAIAIRDVAELIKRGDTLIEKTELEIPFRLSAGYDFVLGYLGVKRGVDRAGAAALMLMKAEGDKAGEFNGLVLAVPVADFAVLADELKIARGDLAEGTAEGKIIDRQPDAAKKSGDVRYAAVRGRHVLLGLSEQHVAAAAKSKSLREALTPEQIATFPEDDIVFYLGHAAIKEGGDHPGLEAEIAKVPPDEAEALRKIVAALPDLRYALGGLQLDGGVRASVSLGFEGDKSRDILTQLQAGGRIDVTLAGLPAKRLLAAHAARGAGEGTAAVARGLMNYALLQYRVDTQQFISAAHRANVVGVFGEVWQRVDGSRVGLYENADSAAHGHFGLVAVLDTKDPAKFIADMQGLTRFINAAGFSLDDAADKIDARIIGELVGMLGNDDYQVRQTATTKLGLIGPPALKSLEAAAKNTDPEVQFRAKLLREQIAAAVAEEKQDLLQGDLLSRLQPQLVFFPKAEQRREKSVDIVQLRLKAGEADHAAQLSRQLGPEWSKLRIATVGQYLVVLLGSNTGLLEQTIDNLQRQGRQPVAPPIVSRLPNEQTAEFHLSLSRAKQLFGGDEVPQLEADEQPPITSFGLQIAPQRVRMTLIAPYEEVRSVIKQLGW